jgi:hypothetical protein
MEFPRGARFTPPKRPARTEVVDALVRRGCSKSVLTEALSDRVEGNIRESVQRFLTTYRAIDWHHGRLQHFRNRGLAHLTPEEIEGRVTFAEIRSLVHSVATLGECLVPFYPGGVPLRRRLVRLGHLVTPSWPGKFALLLCSLFWYYQIMAKSIKVIPKRRGRPATGRDPVSAIRLPVELTAAIDKWAARNEAASRSDAIRRLVELALSGSQPMSQRSPKATSKALDMAGQQIDKLADSSATAEERQQRKRRLLKGPGEFRDLRADLRKPKA